MRSNVLSIALALLLTTVASAANDGEVDLSGFAAVELRWFTDDPAFTDQSKGGQTSLVLSPEWAWEGENRRHQVRFAPFLRVDGRDDERTHFDLREGYWRYVWSDWELTAGVNTVFWGVTESRHLVNVINQVDGVEDIDEEDRLGQPMLQLAVQQPWGRLEGFALLGFRERTFPGGDGRLRTPLVVDTDSAQYESGAEDRRIDLALRWSHFIGDWDLGASVFHGTGREPRLLPDATGGRLIPFYDVIDQYGVDVQYTREAWLWKLEGSARQGPGKTFGAAVGGFEYTFYQVGNSAADVGLLTEYLWDDRDGAAPLTSLDDDIFVGSRLALNDTQDTQALLGAIVDRDDGSTAALVEAERRLGDRYRIEIEARLFFNVDDANPLAAFEQDSFLTLRLSRYF